MKVVGLRIRTRSPPSTASVPSPEKRRRQAGGAVGAGDRVDRHEADIVAVAGVARAGIAEADEETHGLTMAKRSGPKTGALQPTEDGEEAPSSSPAPRPEPPEPRPAPARPPPAPQQQPPRPPPPLPSGPDGATIVATVKSRSLIVGFAPSGRVIAEMWSESPISKPVRSASSAVRDGVDRHQQLDRVAHDVERAAALEARRGLLVDEVDRHLDPDLLAFGEAQEIDVDRQVLDRVELVVARDGAGLLAVDVDLEHRGQEVAGEDQPAGLVEVEGDRRRRGAGRRR